MGDLGEFVADLCEEMVLDVMVMRGDILFEHVSSIGINE